MLNNPHRRYNALTGEWVLVSPHRAKRPWLGQVEKLSPETLLAYDPTCYLCPRNECAGGVFNPDYTGTFVFENDFAALLPSSEDEELRLRSVQAPPPRTRCLSPSPSRDIVWWFVSLLDMT